MEMATNKAVLHDYQNEKLTVKQLAAIKGVSRATMQKLINQYGVDAGMDYVAPSHAGPRPTRFFELDGNQYTTKQLCLMAKSKCSVPAMVARIKKHGVEFAVSCADFQAVKAASWRKTRDMNQPSDWDAKTPKYDPVQHFLDNMIQSLKDAGFSDKEVDLEITKRVGV